MEGHTKLTERLEVMGKEMVNDAQENALALFLFPKNGKDLIFNNTAKTSIPLQTN